MFFNIPMYFTLLRLILIPFFIIIFYLPCKYSSLFSSLIFLIASFTDLLDGFWARQLNRITRFGEFFDPVADKFLTIFAMLLIVECFHVIFITLPISIIIIREVIISALREWMSIIGEKDILSVSKLAKIKTIFQMLTISILLWHFNQYFIFFGIILLYLSMILTLWSMIKYFHIVKNYF
ncbi:CDP-diacylglycerol--glycerol-3-phosphate 3-phosphatidyltransferase [Candidatus Purcelliella pentastirinorum]|uniref:CDP-diacylglycerol--glycerol-3-phosphate 3-phosphatidyltransferase n=1 Tax=Candidatus Purcelliella pentastirinorum TaxID=472834 RepID=A0AAX3N7N7_9ENTR|nr:CDP-diacylglycerol--glycerol-3-phosphate 3-phosphatidyltransferase [Candidatus Purcelliella pentastirinorum]WDI78631.1 CDP-diacylglycerol--glycerol-3-phosphate 3-phosphatidyltransferase [Candidatus Purcelliella pentastirinorum]WDR80341.1 CDP-diacylglycerol--glycerol-3-phosphate 3-phosphatidyltransferase [Candidatus Purcelliella pentastirinorum]